MRTPKVQRVVVLPAAEGSGVMIVADLDGKDVALNFSELEALDIARGILAALRLSRAPAAAVSVNSNGAFEIVLPAPSEAEANAKPNADRILEMAWGILGDARPAIVEGVRGTTH